MKREQIKSPLLEDSEQENKTINNLEIIQPKQHFIFVYDSIYQNKNLNANEIAILIKLLGASPTFKVNANGLMWSLKIPRQKYLDAIKSLKEKGYLKIMKKGKNEYKYIVSQKPDIKPEYLTFEYLSNNTETKTNTKLWKSLLDTKQITKDLYNKLLDNLINNIAKLKWID